uniref:Histone acetyltransferase HPA2 n=1 Tax=uncultured bacterium WWRS-2005 TaxID=334761 RepID=Q1I1A6_9BACT|nr:histone acetyltransferase HPA2 [uncultured bacterium WWRS-2005]
MAHSSRALPIRAARNRVQPPARQGAEAKPCPTPTRALRGEQKDLPNRPRVCPRKSKNYGRTTPSPAARRRSRRSKPLHKAVRRTTALQAPPRQIAPHARGVHSRRGRG